MKAIDPDESAFPIYGNDTFVDMPGMTIRTYLAIRIMAARVQTLTAENIKEIADEISTVEPLAKASCIMADCLIAELNKPPIRVEAE